MPADCNRQGTARASPSPNVGQSNNTLNGVAALTGGDVWSVGSSNNFGPDQTLALRNSGAGMAVTTIPQNGLNAVQISLRLSSSTSPLVDSGRHAQPTEATRFEPALPLRLQSLTDVGDSGVVALPPPRVIPPSDRDADAVFGEPSERDLSEFLS